MFTSKKYNERKGTKQRAPFTVNLIIAGTAHQAHTNRLIQMTICLVLYLLFLDVVDLPDDKSIMAYLMAYYNYFTKMASEDILGQRMRNFLDFEMGIRKDCAAYEKMASELLEWVLMKTSQLNKHDFPNSLVGVQQFWHEFKDYHTQEKPPKSKEKSELQLFLSQIQMKLSSSGRKEYSPPERLELRMINKAWESLESSEKNRASALRKELIRMQIIQQVTRRFAFYPGDWEGGCQRRHSACLYEERG